MHELSLAGSVLQIVEQAALREGFAQVAVLRLEAGALAGVEEHALRFALASLAPGTCLEGARIEIDTPPGRARCTACGTESQIDARTDPCPACGAWGLVPTGGLGLRVLEVLVRDAPRDVVACAQAGASESQRHTPITPPITA